MKKVFKSKNVVFVLDNIIKPASILVENEKIVKISNYEDNFNDTTVYDFNESYLMSGIVDTHAHINEPGRTEWEGFVTATKSALAGGITTIIDMPLNSIPATTSLNALNVKKESAKNSCMIDYGFWGGVIPQNEHELESMVNNGVMGFKCFMCPSGVDEFPHVTKSDLDIAMPILTKLNVPLIVHAEIESEVHCKNQHQNEYQTYLESRPKKWEEDAIKVMIELCEKYKTKTHIVHLSTASILDDIKKVKAKGLPFSVETCPHYLSLICEEIIDGATQFKCAPPIREKENQEKLWEGVKNMIIDFIVSDHSPCTPDLKLFSTGDFIKAWGGIAGLQFSMNVVWTEMKKRGMSVLDLSRLMSFNTAKFIGIENQKGKIDIGNDADFVIFNPNEKFLLKKEDILHRHKVTPYEGRVLEGKVLKTILRGEISFDEGKMVKPNGKFIRRK